MIEGRPAPRMLYASAGRYNFAPIAECGHVAGIPLFARAGQHLWRYVMPDHFNVRGGFADESQIPRKPKTLYVFNGYVDRVVTSPNSNQNTLVWLESAEPFQVAYHEAAPDHPTIDELKRAQSMRLRVYAEFKLKDDKGRLHFLEILSIRSDMPTSP